MTGHQLVEFPTRLDPGFGPLFEAQCSCGARCCHRTDELRQQWCDDHVLERLIPLHPTRERSYAEWLWPLVFTEVQLRAVLGHPQRES